jgi:hypothetical protein
MVMNRIGLSIALVAVMLAAAPSPSFAQSAPPAVGRIKVVSGPAFIVRDSMQLVAKPGEPIFKSDVLKTGNNGRLGVTLKDDTRLSLGPSSEARVDNFVYAPTEGHLALALKVVRGVMAYVSGRIAKLAPDAVQLEAPAAIVGVRGTTLLIKAGA